MSNFVTAFSTANAPDSAPELYPRTFEENIGHYMWTDSVKKAITVRFLSRQTLSIAKALREAETTSFS